MKKTALLVALTILPAIALAQQKTDLYQQSFSSKSAWSLFDPSRLRMSQSYTFGYYSGRGGSASIGYYLNSIEYSFSNPLKVRVDLGFMHNPGALISSSSSRSGAFVPGVSLDWRPSSAFHFRLDVRQVPYINGYNGYYNPGYWEEYR